MDKKTYLENAVALSAECLLHKYRKAFGDLGHRKLSDFVVFVTRL